MNMNLKASILLITAAIICIMLIIGSCQREPVVRPERTNNDTATSAINEHDHDAIIDRMPVTQRQVVESDVAESFGAEDSLNLVTVIAAIGRIVREAQLRGFQKDDYADPEKWNDFINLRVQSGEAFIVKNVSEVDQVIMLEDIFYSAEELFTEFNEIIKELEEEKWIFFLYLAPNEENVVDYVYSYVAMKVTKPDGKSINDLTAIPRMIHREDDHFVIRFATRTPEQDRMRPRLNPPQG